MTRYSLWLEDDDGTRLFVYADVQDVALDRAFPRIEVCGAIRDGLEAMQAARKKQPDREVPVQKVPRANHGTRKRKPDQKDEKTV